MCAVIHIHIANLWGILAATCCAQPPLKWESAIIVDFFRPKVTQSSTTMLLRRLKIRCGQVQKRRYTNDSSFSHITTAQWETIGQYEAELIEWNKKVNLISRKDAAIPGKIMASHIIPCLSISILRSFLPGETVLDAGTGNGLPGIPLAIAHPGSQFSLVESSEKKAKVVRQMVEALKLPNVKVINARVETLEEKFDFIVGRAVAPLPEFLKNVFRLCKKKQSVVQANGRQGNSKSFGPGLFYIKGGDFEEELGLAGVRRFNEYNLSDLSHHALTDSDKKILYITSQEMADSNRRKAYNQKNPRKQSKPQQQQQ